MRFALDTNIISYLWRREGEVGRHLEAVDPSCVGIPTVVLAELVYGRHNNPAAATKLEILLGDLRNAYPILAFDGPSADWYGLLRARFKHQNAPDRDLMIAATCLAHDHVLVTHNTNDFNRIPELKCLDWT